MSASTTGEDRTRLDGFELEIFNLVREKATSKQWKEWLRAPLEHAAAKGNMDLFTRLMDAGADGGAGWRGCHGRTLLGAAAAGKSDEMVLALLKAGAKDEVNVEFGGQRESALHVAAKTDVVSTTTTLMLAGADPNVLDGYKESPLHWAAEAGHDGVVNTLLLKGADPNAKEDRSGQTPLHIAAEEGHTLCVSKLVAGGADKDSLDRFGGTPLVAAAIFGHLGAVEELLAAGANVHIREHRVGGMVDSFCNPLDFAAREGAVDVVRALLRHGSSVTASDDKGYTALHWAAHNDRSDRDNSDVVKVLLQAGADIEAKCGGDAGDDGLTPLYFAAGTDSGATVRALLEGGADFNVRPRGGSPPLFEACFGSHADVVELLLRWGADEKVTYSRWQTPEDTLGEWQRFEDSWYEGPDADPELRERIVTDRRIRHMLARAPADRSWRRRGWLVLARSCPAKVQLAHDSGGGGTSGGGSSAKAAKGSYGGGDGSGDETAALARLVGRVVNLDAEGIFRLVVGFL